MFAPGGFGGGAVFRIGAGGEAAMIPDLRQKAGLPEEEHGRSAAASAYRLANPRRHCPPPIASTMAIRWPSQSMTFTAMELPSALYRGPSAAQPRR